MKATPLGQRLLLCGVLADDTNCIDIVCCLLLYLKAAPDFNMMLYTVGLKEIHFCVKEGYILIIFLCQNKLLTVCIIQWVE